MAKNRRARQALDGAHCDTKSAPERSLITRAKESAQTLDPFELTTGLYLYRAAREMLEHRVYRDGKACGYSREAVGAAKVILLARAMQAWDRGEIAHEEGSLMRTLMEIYSAEAQGRRTEDESAGSYLFL